MAKETFEYSGNVYEPAAGTTTFALTSSDGNAIEYLQRSHILVSKSTDSGVSYAVLARPDDWDFSTDGRSVVLSTGTTAGDWIKVKRDTPTDDPYINFDSGSLLTADQLNQAEDFSLYCDQELQDRVSSNEEKAGLADAPDDGAQYGRQSKTWTKTLSDVTETGQFVRETGKWTAADFLRDADSDNSIYGRRNGEWQSITISGINYRGTVDATQAAPTAQNGDFYVNTATSGRPDASWAGIADVDLTGGERLIFTEDTQQWQVLPAPQVQNASETTRGVIELATQAETDTATDDFRAVTPLKLRTGYVPRDLDLLDALPDSGGGGGGTAAVTVTSNSFTTDVPIGQTYYYDDCAPNANNTSPQLSWSIADLQEGVSVASWNLLCVDTDADDLVHWHVTNIPADQTNIAENGDWQNGAQVQTDELGDLVPRANGWVGPCPPEQHTYRIVITAVLDNGSTVQSAALQFIAD